MCSHDPTKVAEVMLKVFIRDIVPNTLQKWKRKRVLNILGLLVYLDFLWLMRNLFPCSIFYTL